MAEKQGGVVCYARVSTIEQNPENQFEDLKARASQFGEYELLTETESTRNTRPIKEGLMQQCRLGKVKMIIVWKLDRLARSAGELIQNLEEFKKLKVRFIAIRDGIDLDPNNISPIQELYYNLLSSFAQFERDLNKERQAAGYKRAKAEGKHLGRPKGAKDKKQRRTIGYYKN